MDIDSKMTQETLKDLNNSNLTANIVDISNFKEVENCTNEILKNLPARLRHIVSSN